MLNKKQHVTSNSSSYPTSLQSVHLACGNAHTWACGTPRSQNNAFCIAPRYTPEQLAAQAKTKTKSAKRYDQKLAAQGRTRADTAKSKATRVNKEASIASFIPNSVTAPR